MKRILFFAALALACNKPDAAGASASSSASAAPAPPPAPFTGKLTGERVMGAKGIARPFMAWSDAEPKLEAQLGKPTLVKDKKSYWAVAEGDDCWYVMVERQANDQVGVVQSPMKVSKGGAIRNWDECLEAAGVRKEAAEDPNAPGPPTDGKPVDVTALLAGATKARSKWSKANVTVRGLYMNTTRTTSGDLASTNVTLTAAKSDLKNTIDCELADPKSEPPKLMQYTPITATGEVDVADTLTLGGERGVSVSLRRCAIKVAAGK